MNTAIKFCAALCIILNSCAEREAKKPIQALWSDRGIMEKVGCLGDLPVEGSICLRGLESWHISRERLDLAPKEYLQLVTLIKIGNHYKIVEKERYWEGYNPFPNSKKRWLKLPVIESVGSEIEVNADKAIFLPADIEPGQLAFLVRKGSFGPWRLWMPGKEEAITSTKTLMLVNPD